MKKDCHIGSGTDLQTWMDDYNGAVNQAGRPSCLQAETSPKTNSTTFDDVWTRPTRPLGPPAHKEATC